MSCIPCSGSNPCKNPCSLPSCKNPCRLPSCKNPCTKNLCSKNPCSKMTCSKDACCKSTCACLKKLDNARNLYGVALICYLSGIFFWITYLPSILITILILKRGYIKRRRKTVIMCCVVEIIGWVTYIALQITAFVTRKWLYTFAGFGVWFVCIFGFGLTRMYWTRLVALRVAAAKDVEGGGASRSVSAPPAIQQSRPVDPSAPYPPPQATYPNYPAAVTPEPTANTQTSAPVSPVSVDTMTVPLQPVSTDTYSNATAPVEHQNTSDAQPENSPQGKVSSSFKDRFAVSAEEKLKLAKKTFGI